jgi:hypothetical protein
VAQTFKWSLEEVTEHAARFTCADVPSAENLEAFKQLTGARDVTCVLECSKTLGVEEIPNYYTEHEYCFYRRTKFVPDHQTDFMTLMFEKKLAVIRSQMKDRWLGMLVAHLERGHMGVLQNLFKYARDRVNELHKLTEFSFLDIFALELHPIQLIPEVVNVVIKGGGFEKFRRLATNCVPLHLRTELYNKLDVTSWRESLRSISLASWKNYEPVAKECFKPEFLTYWIRYQHHNIRYKNDTTAKLILLGVIKKFSNTLNWRAVVANLYDYRNIQAAVPFYTDWYNLESLAYLMDSGGTPKNLARLTRNVRPSIS